MKSVYLFIAILIVIEGYVCAIESLNTSISSSNTTNISETPIPDFELLKFFPKELKTGEVQFKPAGKK